MTQLNLSAASPAELRAECDRLGVTYRTKDDRKTLTRKIVNASKSDDTPMTADELRDPKRIADALDGKLDPPKSKSKTTAKSDDVPTYAEDRSERYKLAKIEKKALDAWAANDCKGEQPATPNLDKMNADYESGAPKAKSNSKRKSDSESKRGALVVIGDGMRFYRDGTPYSDRDNGRLSNVAARAKISASELRDALVKAGVALDSPLSKPFSVTVSSGVKIELRRESKSQRAAS